MRDQLANVRMDAGDRDCASSASKAYTTASWPRNLQKQNYALLTCRLTTSGGNQPVTKVQKLNWTAQLASD